MKNINFSPLARIGFHKGFRKKTLLLFEGFVFLLFLGIILWHKQIDFHQDQILLEQDQILLEKPIEKSTPTPTDLPIDLPTKSKNREFSNKKKSIIKETDIQIQEDETQKADTLKGEENNLETVDFETDQAKKFPVTNYYLKAFSGVIKKDVEKVADYLVQKHFSPRIIREPGFSYMNNVYVSLDTSLSIKEMLHRLKKDGFSGYVPVSSKKNFPVRISSCYYKESAEDILENLKSKGYFGTIMEENTAVKVYAIYLGQYPDIMAVLQAQKELMVMGFPTTMITTDFPSLE